MGCREPNAFVDGIVVLSFGLMAAGHHERRWPLVFGGVVGIATGVLTVIYPGSIALTLVYAIGAWAIIIGILEIAAAIRLRNVITSLVYAFGFHAILAGIAQISLGVRLQGMGQALQLRTQQAASPSR